MLSRADCHLHIINGNVDNLIELTEIYQVSQFSVLSIPTFILPLNNLECLAVKASVFPKAYAFGGFDYPKGKDSDFSRQLDLMLNAGFDGIKFIETKPTIMKQTKCPLSDDCFTGVFERLSSEQIPILWHVGDPATFWDCQTVPQFAVDNGWCYTDGTYPTLASLYQHAEKVLSRFPNLRVCFAHFYFCADDISHAASMMEQYPNVRFDITPGTEMYPLFMQNRDIWRPFFMKYRDRILFGTDGTDKSVTGDEYADTIKLITCFIEGDTPFRAFDIEGTGFGLDLDTAEKIYTLNYQAFIPRVPKPINMDGANKLAAYIQNIAPDAYTDLIETLINRIRQFEGREKY